jgi:nucleotide-binding universal stress UspA family protein
MSGRVVVGVDTTPSGLQALRRAVAEAQTRGWRLHAVRAWGPIATSWYVSIDDQRQRLAEGAVKLVDQAFIDILGAFPIGVVVETVAVPGEPGPVLVREANQPDDLLVVGAGRRGLRRLLRNGVARYCVAHATCPVLVVPAPTEAESPRAMLRQLRRELDSL